MTTDLERRLRQALHDDADCARLVNPDQPRAAHSLARSDAPPPKRPVRRLAVVAAAVTLIVGAGIVLGQSADDRTPEVTTSPGPTKLFTDIPPGSTVSLPPAPIDPLAAAPAAVWTGKEIVVWGGIGARETPVGAAFDLATGTWRVIAPAPIQARSFAQVAWTGTEMIVWGGLHSDGSLTEDGAAYNHTKLADGAAYNPLTDTWRRLPEAPIETDSGSNAVWTGEEFIVFGGEDTIQAAAFDPAANEWRRLADSPEVNRSGGTVARSVWTGTTILTIVESLGPVLARYDLSADTWHVDDEARYAALVGIPDDDDVTRTVIGIPFDTGAPVDLLDHTGTPTDRLPGHPGDNDVVGDHIEATGIWLDGEARFWIRGHDWAVNLTPDPPPEAWALDPATRIWRELPAGSPPGDPVMAIDDLLLFADESADSDITRAVLYRPPT